MLVADGLFTVSAPAVVFPACARACGAVAVMSRGHVSNYGAHAAALEG
jgi:hypothetical protein